MEIPSVRTSIVSVRERPLAARGKRPEPNSERHREHERGEGENGADGEPCCEDVLDGGAREAKRKPEIATEHTADIAHKLLGERPIETVFRPPTRFELDVPRLIAEQNQNGVARHKLKGAESENDRHEQHEQDAEDPAEGEAPRGAQCSSRRLAVEYRNRYEYIVTFSDSRSTWRLMDIKITLKGDIPVIRLSGRINRR